MRKYEWKVQVAFGPGFSFTDTVIAATRADAKAKANRRAAPDGVAVSAVKVKVVS